MFRPVRERLLDSAESCLLAPTTRCCRRVYLRCFSPVRLPQNSLPHPPFIKLHVLSLASSFPSCPLPPRMDPSGAPSPGPDPYNAEDYVHVSNPLSEEVQDRQERPELGSALPTEADERSEDQDSSGGGLGGAEGPTEEGVTEGKRILPEELAKSVVLLQCESSAEGGSCDVHLVGTAHVSQESCREVQAIINCLKPQVVFLELCSSRISILTPQNLQVPTMTEMMDMWKKKKMNAFGILYSWFLAKVAQKLEVLPGAEFRVAYEEAMGYGGKVILGDRPVHITLKRTWGKMTLWHKTKFLYYILFQTIFLPSPEDLNKMLKDMDNVDMLTLVIQEMSKAFPTLMDTLLHERDMYMSSTLLRVAREHSSVVAVVGKGHLSGIQKNWKQPIQMKNLLEIPPRSGGLSRTKVIASIGAAFTGVAAATGIYLLIKR
ncbi:traB domain-containing protein [Canna indica]|uniref:TraB domain-containing protein n=1 Tax=Canna indica TaxID=4628 RepID=A0AAQ3QCP6_9LILI|nr:traB domain-containing protein [Canna indica]